MPADHACFPMDASPDACYPRSERTRHSRLSKTQQRSVLGTRVSQRYKAAPSWSLFPSELRDDNPSRELSSESSNLASHIRHLGIMGKLNLPTVSVVCDEKVTHLPTIHHITPKTPRDARARSPAYHEPPAKASAPTSYMKPRAFAFFKKRANTMHSHPITGDKQAPPYVTLARANTHPPPSLRQPRGQPSIHPDFAFRASRDKSQSTKMHNKPQSTQDRCPSVLDRQLYRIGDAPTSPLYERNTKENSPIDTAFRRIQEAGLSARAKALQTAGSLLHRIGKQQVDKKAVCNVAFINLIDVFERVGLNPSLKNSSIDFISKQFPLDNVEEIAREFQLFSILVREEVMEGNEFIRAAKFLRDEGHHDGCKLLLRLIFDDRRLKLTDVESTGLTDVASDMDLERGKQNAISVIAIVTVHGGQKTGRWWIG
ncbi:hypothetical protein ACEPAG_9512 [Sanghuangporus baumii]